jgi:hypothetical protein
MMNEYAASFGAVGNYHPTKFHLVRRSKAACKCSVSIKIGMPVSQSCFLLNGFDY